MFGFYDIFLVLREINQMEARLRLAFFEGENRVKWERRRNRKWGETSVRPLPVQLHRKLMCHNPRDSRS